jgi:hypothetical protein
MQQAYDIVLSLAIMDYVYVIAQARGDWTKRFVDICTPKKNHEQDFVPPMLRVGMASRVTCAIGR